MHNFIAMHDYFPFIKIAIFVKIAPVQNFVISLSMIPNRIVKHMWQNSLATLAPERTHLTTILNVRQNMCE